MTDDQKRQLYLLAGLLVALGVILYFQIGKLERLRNQEGNLSPEAVAEQVRRKVLPLRTGTGPEDVVQVTGMEVFDPNMSIVAVHEVEHPENRHLVWVNPASPITHFVALDFLPQDVVDATEPLYRGLSAGSGAMEWDVGDLAVRGIPDGFGGDFDITGSELDVFAFHRYHLTRDSLPIMVNPSCVTAEAAVAEEVMGGTWETYLRDEDRVLGLECGGEAKAYPIKVLNFHEMVNDTCGGEPVLVVYSPLTGSGMAYEARIGDATSLFGHSGLLLESATLIYDRETRSLWTHFEGEAVAGPSRGQRLETLPVVQTTWKAWREMHPETLVLSGQTGVPYRYGLDPYRQDFRTNYYAMERLIAPITLPGGGFSVAVAPIDDRISNKEWIIGLRGATTQRAYPISELARQADKSMTVEIEGAQVELRFDPESETGYALDGEGRPVPTATLALWFAWRAGYPNTELFLAQPGSS